MTNNQEEEKKATQAETQEEFAASIAKKYDADSMLRKDISKLKEGLLEEEEEKERAKITYEEGEMFERTEIGELPGIGASWEEIEKMVFDFSDDVEEARKKFIASRLNEEEREYAESNQFERSSNEIFSWIIGCRFSNSGNRELNNKWIAMDYFNNHKKSKEDGKQDDLAEEYAMAYNDKLKKGTEASLELFVPIEKMLTEKGLEIFYTYPGKLAMSKIHDDYIITVLIFQGGNYFKDQDRAVMDLGKKDTTNDLPKEERRLFSIELGASKMKPLKERRKISGPYDLSSNTDENYHTHVDNFEQNGRSVYNLKEILSILDGSSLDEAIGALQKIAQEKDEKAKDDDK